MAKRKIEDTYVQVSSEDSPRKKQECMELNDDDDDDPGIIILFASDAAIHQVLGCGAVANIPVLRQGQDAQESRENLESWLDGLVNSYATPNSLVYGLDHVKVSGLYHRLKLNEYMNIVGEVTKYNEWVRECVENHYSAGKWLSIAGAGKGTTEIIQSKTGPFQG